MKAQANIYAPVHESVVFIILKRRDIDEDSSKAFFGQFMRFGYLLHSKEWM